MSGVTQLRDGFIKAALGFQTKEGSGLWRGFRGKRNRKDSRGGRRVGQKVPSASLRHERIEHQQQQDFQQARSETHRQGGGGDDGQRRAFHLAETRAWLGLEAAKARRKCPWGHSPNSASLPWRVMRDKAPWLTQLRQK
jgi:hypothetical protein